MTSPRILFSAVQLRSQLSLALDLSDYVLRTAYHLAKANHRRDAAHLHKVIVVEAAGREFAATSSTNSGILTDTYSNEFLIPLTQYSYQQWEGLGNDTKKFSKECGYREGVIYSLKRDSGIGQNLIPD